MPSWAKPEVRTPPPIAALSFRANPAGVFARLALSRLKFLCPDIARFLERVRQCSLTVSPAHTLTESKHDPDNRFLEYAEAAKADYL